MLLTVTKTATSWQRLSVSRRLATAIAAPDMGFNGFHERYVLLSNRLYQSHEQGLFSFLRCSLGKPKEFFCYLLYHVLKLMGLTFLIDLRAVSRIAHSLGGSSCPMALYAYGGEKGGGPQPRSIVVGLFISPSERVLCKSCTNSSLDTWEKAGRKNSPEGLKPALTCLYSKQTCRHTRKVRDKVG
jgi:hypothetical protein